MSDPAAIERYLHRHIPLSREMAVRVACIDESGVRLAAPIGPNINHRSTVFGGSASALAILSAWTLVHVRVRAAGLAPHVVIQRNAMEYLLPIHGDFEAHCRAPDPQAWSRFLDLLSRRGRARLTLHAELFTGAQVAGTFQGSFVALTAEE